ncbi:MAG: hypothetical protein FWE36_06925 [Erysipelotrichales bacterium]|nr:hypothetical protein [Erysipelotrichales bacterium]
MSKKDDKFNELISEQSEEIKRQIIKMNKLLIDGGCKVAVDNKGNFTYTSKNSKKIICRITMNEKGSSIRPNTNNAKSLNNITAQLPESMLEVMRSTRGCGGCAKKNPDFIECSHGGPFQFSHNEENFESCRFVGFNFNLNNIEICDLIAKWIEIELADNL